MIDFLDPRLAAQRYGGAKLRQDATPESIDAARQNLAAANIAKAIRTALAAGPLSRDRRAALASLLLDEEAAQ